MKVVIISKASFSTTQYTGVKNIAYADNVATLTLSDNTTASFSLNDYSIGILW